jgi:uncharacterized membrane protein
MMKACLVSLALFAAAACGGASRPEATPAASSGDLKAAESAAFARARPVFDKHCARCHTKDGTDARPKALEHFDMTSYPFGGHHADDITAEIRAVLAIPGGKPTMPLDQPGAVTGNELALIAAWADAYDKAHPAGAHGDHHHDHR